MNDMRAVIIPKSDQINADDLIGGPKTITIREVSIRPGTEQPVSIHFENDGNKPYKPCKSMARVMVQCWGPDANAYVGKSMTLYRDPAVKWGGLAVGGIRISHMSDISGTQTMALTETKGKRTPFVVRPLVATMPVEQKPALSEAWQEYLPKLSAAFDRCSTADAVDAVAGKQSVRDALSNGPDAVKVEINRMVNAALDRVAPATEPPSEPPDDIDDFPGTVTQAAAE